MAKRLGLKPTVIKNAIDKVSKHIETENEDDLLRATLIQLYWATPTIGGRLRPLSVKFDDFVNFLSDCIFSVDNEQVVIDTINSFEDTLVNDFDVSSLNLMGEKLTHFSAKLTHSKATGSVFVPGNRTSDLPYLFSGSLQKTAPLPVDLTKNDGDANAQSIVKLLNGDSANINFDVAKKMTDWYQSKKHQEKSTQTIDARIRQIMLPKEDGSYCIVSPLYAGGISRRINELANEKKLNGDRIQIPFGGANPQNVSVHGQYLKYVWLFDTPTIDRNIRVAYIIAFRGYWVSIDKNIATAYSDWVQQNPNYGSDRNTLESREIERKQSPFYPMIHKIIDRLESTIQECEIAKDAITQKMEEIGKNHDEINPLEQSILSGLFTEAAVNDLTSRIIRAMNKSEIYATESTRARHLKVIPEIIKSRLQITLGGN